ncbi:MAG: hypothetical protein MIO92_12390, partial [Methanosarcinaceae archaeon]|nr:hypothetical protein [Methanosarcinaceae archaeon]
MSPLIEQGGRGIKKSRQSLERRFGLARLPIDILAGNSQNKDMEKIGFHVSYRMGKRAAIGMAIGVLAVVVT